MLRFFSSLVTTLLLSVLISNPAQAAVVKNQVQRANEDNLTSAFAEMRKSQVTSVHYTLRFTLKKGEDLFRTHTTIDATLARTDWPLSIDVKADTIHAVRVNGVEVKDYVTRTGSFDLPAKVLAKSVKIEIETSSVYNNEGEGFQRSIDPADKAEYVFTDFEPNHAHRLFPCFDQPDLKATYDVTVTAPKDWVVIGNTLVQSSENQGDQKTTTFQRTPVFSTYLFFLGAGPFVEFKDQEGSIPLTIYARKTLAKYVDAPRLFEVTKKGLRFFGDYFGYPYPFPKYSQIFIPEFAWGGMENVGAVALNERNIFRGAVSQSRLQWRDGLILHEMAHMWFGDLVTMKWWNDLWLNESFASYVSAIAQERAMGSKQIWLDFFSEKNWGYWQDQLITTHPIETKVPDVRTAKGNFDGITYAKGAASLKQLHFFVGDDAFRDGLRAYFKKYAFGNTERADFLGSIQTAAKQDLRSWTKSWLQTAGPNRVETVWTCAKDRIATFKILQAPSVSKTLSPHRTRVAIYSTPESGPFEVLKTVDVTYSEKSTSVKSLIGQPCPGFVFANAEDQDYALFSLDPVSLKRAKEALSGRLTDPLTRLMVWSALAQMVRDVKLPVTEYFEITLPALEAEKEDPLLAIVASGRSPLSGYFDSYLTPEQRRALAPRFEKIITEKLRTSPAKSDAQLTMFDFFVTVAETPESLALLSEYLRGKNLPSGLELDQDRRWRVVAALARRGAEGTGALVDEELKRDKTTQGERNAFAAKAAIPDESVKRSYWDTFQKPEGVPYSNLRAASGSFHTSDHAELSKAFVEPLFSKVTSLDWNANDNLVEIYFENLFPQNICSKELLKESQSRMKRAKNLTPLARRGWLEANDELSRCVAVRAHALAAP